jgi:hypothetical protein
MANERVFCVTVAAQHGLDSGWYSDDSQCSQSHNNKRLQTGGVCLPHGTLPWVIGMGAACGHGPTWQQPNGRGTYGRGTSFIPNTTYIMLGIIDYCIDR